MYKRVGTKALAIPCDHTPCILYKCDELCGFSITMPSVRHGDALLRHEFIQDGLRTQMHSRWHESAFLKRILDAFLALPQPDPAYHIHVAHIYRDVPNSVSSLRYTMVIQGVSPPHLNAYDEPVSAHAFNLSVFVVLHYMPQPPHAYMVNLHDRLRRRLHIVRRMAHLAAHRSRMAALVEHTLVNKIAWRAIKQALFKLGEHRAMFDLWYSAQED